MTDDELVALLNLHIDRFVVTVDANGEPFRAVNHTRLSAPRIDGVEQKIILWLDPDTLNDCWEIEPMRPLGMKAKPTPGWRGGWPDKDVARARRAAERVGLRVIKGRWPNRIDPHNKGALKLVNGHGYVVAGADFDLSPERAIAFCSTWNEDEWISDQLDRLWAKYERDKEVFGFRCGIINGVHFIARFNLSEAWCRRPAGAEGQWQDTEVTDALREALVANMQVN